MNDEEKVTYFAETDSRNRRIKFGIKAKDRTRHIYVIGKTGMGKSTMLENMAVQDIQNGEGLAFIDPHGATAEKLLDYIPEKRIKDVLYFAPFDMEHPVSFNVMEDVGYDKRHLVVSGLMSAFEKIWEDAWSARMEYILSNTLLALLEYPDSTLLDVNRMLVDKAYRKKVVDYVSDPLVKSFWMDEFASYTDRYTQEATPAIQNKIGQFTSNPLIRNIVGQPKSTFDIREMMDNKKILICNLSKGRMGETNADLLGSMLITKIYLSAMSRADVDAKVLNKLPNFYFYVDEFQSFANRSFANILSEARKYKLNLTMAHQYIEQMSEEVRAAVFGNVGTMITFRVGSYDAEVLEKEFAPRFTAEDLVNLGFAQIYLRLMIDGISSSPFSAVTLPPIKEPERNLKAEVVENSRKTFARSRAEVEESIKLWGGKNNNENNSAPPNGRRGMTGGDLRKLETGEKKPVAPRRRVESGSAGRVAPLFPNREEEVRRPIAPKPSPSNHKDFSLDSLKRMAPKPEDKKPSQRNLGELRSALASVLAQQAPREAGETKKEQPKKETPPKAEPKKEGRPATAEVSKDVLENILKMDENS